MNLNLNEHVNVDSNFLFGVKFIPDDGYALWRDDMTGNLDENGQPIHYYLSMICGRSQAETIAPHIFARLIDDTMQVYGNGKPPVESE